MAITNAQLTEATLEGNGLFDLLMRSVKTHLDAQYSQARIKGPEYAEVYLGALQAILQNATTFLLERDLKDLERQILEVKLQQALLEKDKIAAEVQLVQAQVVLAGAEKLKIDADILRINAQKELTEQQAENLALEAANIPKIGAKLDAETALVSQQEINLTAEALNIPKQGALLDAQEAKVTADTAVSNQQASNLALEAANIPKQGLVLDGQKCKLDAEFDVLMEQKLKAVAETGVLNQKKVTEQAQTNGTGIDANSVIGKQITLYQAQADGFKRDAEQKAAKIMVESWNARRATDEATVADGTNKLADAYIGQAITKLLAGAGA